MKRMKKNSVALDEWVYVNLEAKKPKEQSIESYVNYVLKDWLIAKINGDI